MLTYKKSQKKGKFFQPHLLAHRGEEREWLNSSRYLKVKLTVRNSQRQKLMLIFCFTLTPALLTLSRHSSKALVCSPTTHTRSRPRRRGEIEKERGEGEIRPTLLGWTPFTWRHPHRCGDCHCKETIANGRPPTLLGFVVATVVASCRHSNPIPREKARSGLQI